VENGDGEGNIGQKYQWKTVIRLWDWKKKIKNKKKIDGHPRT
jgi:hypothetical protein